MKTKENSLILVGKPSYCEALSRIARKYFRYLKIDSTTKEFVNKQNWKKLLKELQNDRTRYFDFISLPSGFIPCNATAVAEFGEYLQDGGLVFSKYFSLPLNLARIVDNKLLTYKYLALNKHLQKNIPWYVPAETLKNYDEAPYPLVFRDFFSSGGRGNQLIASKDELQQLPLRDGFYTEFLRGFEVTQTLLILNKETIALPQTWKNETSHKMLHSDQKPKFAGIFPESKMVRDIAIKVALHFKGNCLISVQCLLIMGKNGIRCKILELESRITGSTPIMEAAGGISISKTLMDWLLDKKIRAKNLKPVRTGCQYISYSKDAKNLKLTQILGVKEEYQTEEHRPRYRISFVGKNTKVLLRRADIIAKKINDPKFVHEIKNGLENLMRNTITQQ